MNRRKTTKRSSLGHILQQARKEHSKSLEEASHVLHIPLRQLEALEQDSPVGVFAAPVYAFGALKTYATWLGLEGQALERMLASQLRAAHASRSDLKVHTLPRWYEQLINPRTIIFTAGLLVALIIGSYVLWQVRSFWRLPALTITEPQEALTEADRVVIMGTTEKGTIIEINGEPVALQTDNTFSQEIPLSVGITIVRIEATNAAGRTKIVEKHLLRTENTSKVR